MTKKDYQKLAEAFKKANAIAEGQYEAAYALQGIAIAIALIEEVLKKDNPKFDSKKFRNAIKSTV